MGGSGGGPHALACAALLPDRVVRASCFVGVAPLGTPGLDREAWLAGMDPENVKEFGWAEAGEDVLAPELERENEAMKERVASDPATVLGGFDLSDSDRAGLARPEIAQVIRESIPEQTRNGVWGWVDDDLAVIRPWGFDVEVIAVPVLVWYGSTDVLVPAAHGKWLAENVPGCLVKVDDVAGHLASDPVQEITENMGVGGAAATSDSAQAWESLRPTGSLPIVSACAPGAGCLPSPSSPSPSRCRRSQRAGPRRRRRPPSSPSTAPRFARSSP